MSLSSAQDRQGILRAAGALSRLEGREIYSIFTSQASAIAQGDRQINALEITALVEDGDLGDTRRGTAYEINGKAYTVRDLKPDGLGFTLLTLKVGPHNG